MVEIPDDVAKREAERLRWLAGQEEQRCGGKGTGESPRLYAIADLLDPFGPTLREQVLGVIRAAWYSDYSTPEGTADAVLAVVADWLAAQPLMSPEETMRLGLSRPLTRDDQRNHDVRLIRGGGDRG